jgi:exo-1,4-beta-D-glucosaminidase
MKIKYLFSIIMTIGILSSVSEGQKNPHWEILLRDNWIIQSSGEIKEDGKTISLISYQTGKWYPATVPSTIFGTLVENKVYPDPYYGTNIESIPGYFTQRSGEIPVKSPFRDPWWYRTIFTLPSDLKGKNTWLKFHSINYKANIWLNGHLIADTTVIEGAYRLYDLNITEFAQAGNKNCLALEIFPPKGTDLTITWVDWNPTPPDRGTGIWYDVSVHLTGPVAMENTFIKTKLNLPSTDKARLTISTELTNSSGKKITGILKGRIGNINFSRKVTLAPDENRLVIVDPDEFRQLEISDPKLWWPHTVGPQNLYDLLLTFEIRGKVSDEDKVRFGIREITSWMNNFDGKHTRVFQINGKNIVIRGGGYVEDMMLRPSDKRIDTDIMYAKHMGLNALRLEAPRGSDHLFEKCDEEGIMLMVGWCCCSSWERWKNWTPDVVDVAQKSWHDQIVRLRNHPSVFDWLLGSDNHPTADVEKMYIQVLNDFDGTRPYQSSATQDSSTVSGHTGLWMGPFPRVYSYRPPVFWYGKLEFNTEAGPSGEQIPPLETMRKMMPEKDLWPISNSWNIRLHKNFFPDARSALFSRYGEPAGVEEYSMKSQVLQYEATRAMFEAYAANKYRASGIIYWMYNSAWPSLYWQLYDYFFAPNGAFYGTKKACENLHIQYSYDDGSIRVVNGNYQDINGLKAFAKLYNFNLQEIFSREVPVDIKADESKKVILTDFPVDPGDVYFLKLVLTDNSGKEISSNFYWLSGNGDEKADFTSLNKLPGVKLNYSVSPLQLEGGKYTATIEVENPSASLAFSVNPKILKHDSKDLVLPVFWEDNYFSLLPGEKRDLKVEFNAEDLGGTKPLLAIDGWNIVREEKELK